MRIGILGSAIIGGSLGRLWAAAGHEVMFASRHPADLEDLAAKAGHGAQVGAVEDAMAFGDLLLDALPFKASVGIPPEPVAGKTLITASNYYPKERDGEIDLEGLSQSEFLASRLTDTRVVKAFNMMDGEEIAARADGKNRGPLAIYHAGDDPEAVDIAAQLIAEAKFAPVYVGTLADGALFQSHARLYNKKYSKDEAIEALAKCQADGGSKAAG